MTSYSKDIERIKDPENIHEAVYASSPYGLMTTFENDLTVRRLINAGHEVVPLIEKELKENWINLHEITLACFAYILQKVDLESAAKILSPVFVQAIKQPGPFFVNFAAYPLRKVFKLPTKPLGDTNTQTELLETLEASTRQIKIDEGSKDA